MDRQHRLVLLGKQGAGKGTQAARLAAHYRVAHVATGDMFRAQASLGTAFGLEAKRYMDAGELVPDEIVIGIIEECIVPGAPLGDGFVLDGFPRTLNQARELDRVLAGAPLDLAVDLQVPTDIVLDRIAGRRVCENCQRLYHVNMPPAHNWTCETCGGHVRQRDDDTVEAVVRRLELYESQTVPIIEYYRNRGLLVEVDGVGEGDEVFKRLVESIDENVS